MGYFLIPFRRPEGGVVYYGANHRPTTRRLAAARFDSLGAAAERVNTLIETFRRGGLKPTWGKLVEFRIYGPIRLVPPIEYAEPPKQRRGK